MVLQKCGRIDVRIWLTCIAFSGTPHNFLNLC